MNTPIWFNSLSHNELEKPSKTLDNLKICFGGESRIILDLLNI